MPQVRQGAMVPPVKGRPSLRTGHALSSFHEAQGFLFVCLFPLKYLKKEVGSNETQQVSFTAEFPTHVNHTTLSLLSVWCLLMYLLGFNVIQSLQKSQQRRAGWEGRKGHL